MAAREDSLRQLVWRGGAVPAAMPAVPTGHALLDSLLPGGGWPRGLLTEILGGQGIGELQLVMPALVALTWSAKRVVWVAPPHLPYAPALAAAGLDLAHLSVVHAPRRRDALWAAEQVLRTHCCHAVLAWLPRADYDELRRLAVAADAGPAWVALYRPSRAAAESSPAALRLALEPGADALVVRVLKRRGGPPAAPLRLPVDRPVHALGRHSFSEPASARAGADRRLGLPVHA